MARADELASQPAMKFKRALDRVALAMGLEGAGDGRS